jgi:hypothetical protein
MLIAIEDFALCESTYHAGGELRVEKRITAKDGSKGAFNWDALKK